MNPPSPNDVGKAQTFQQLTSRPDQIILHCIYPGCTTLEFPWCLKHDLWHFKRRARDVFGWSDLDK